MQHASAMQARPAIAALWSEANFPATALSHLHLTGADPVLPSSFAIGTAAQTSIGAAALAAAELWRLRTGQQQDVSVDMRHAAIEFRSERYFRLAGSKRGEVWDRIAGLYRCGDATWVRLHTNFPHHRDRVLQLLKCDYDRQSVARALQRWAATEFEEAAAQVGAVVAAYRSFAEWDTHPQAQAIAAEPLVAIDRIGESHPRPLPNSNRPLGGVRVLDLTRVIAGPICGRTLAAHGADVLLVTGPSLPAIHDLVIDTGRGKLSCEIELATDAGRNLLETLLQQADVFVQAYRPGALSKLGFGLQQAARLRPGIIYAVLCAYGYSGPWSGRRGFDSLVQTATGLNAAEAEAAGANQPKPLPAQALDHASGYLLAFGVLAALYRRATEGGSWHVRVSLARTGAWLRGLGRVADGFACPDPQLADVQDLLEESDSGFGRLSAVRHSAVLTATPARWSRPTVPLGTHPAAWP